MQIRIALATTPGDRVDSAAADAVFADDVRAVVSLHNWLRQDPELNGDVVVSRAAQDEPGLMGAETLDVINIVLTQAVAVGNFALAFAAWFRSRPTVPKLTLSSAQTTITIADASPETIARIVELLSVSAPPPEAPALSEASEISAAPALSEAPAPTE